MPRFLASALLLVLGVGDYAGEEARPLLGPGAPILTRPVPLDPANPARRTVGALTFLGGWSLSSPDRAFGSVSAMMMTATAKGDRFTMLSDSGGVMIFDMDGAGVTANIRFLDLPAGPHGGFSKGARDSEAMAVDPASGRIWVAFENRNLIWRYAPGFARGEQKAWPLAMRAWPQASGPEAMVRLRSGRFVVIAEAAPGPQGADDALIFPGDPTTPGIRPLRFGYRRPAGWRVTDVAELPDGRLLVLHRRVRLAEMKVAWIEGAPRLVRGIDSLIRVIDLKGVKDGGVVDGVDVAHLAWPMTADNFEAMAISEEKGRTILWIASDHNFAFYQRTLLMKFALGALPTDATPARSTARMTPANGR